MTRTIPAELVRKYQAEGWWTTDTFQVHSAVRPWQGTGAQSIRP